MAPEATADPHPEANVSGAAAPPDPSRSISIRWSLLGSMLALLVLLSSAITVTTVVGERRIARALSSSLTARAIEQTSDRLERFFDPVTASLDLLRSWTEGGLVDTDETDAVNRLLVPVMRPHPQISALLLADERGHHHMLMRTGGRWHTRLTRRDAWGIRQRRLEWADGDQTAAVSWHEVDYDPRTRPWYRGAVDGSPAPGFVHWTEPYTFFTLKEPGITASVAVSAPDGREGVVAVDVLLSDISAYTTTLRPTTQGAVVVLTDGGRVIGLPQGPRFADPAARTSAMLKKPDDLGLGVVVAAMEATDTRASDDPGPIRFAHEGQQWWGEVRSFPLGRGRALSMAVVVPESDLVGVLGAVRWWILVITAGALALAIVWAIALARRYCRPIEVLAHENERIGTGDLEPGPAIRSRLTEVRRLARAHERMRVALRTLFKVERDLQLARQIQQSDAAGDAARPGRIRHRRLVRARGGDRRRHLRRDRPRRHGRRGGDRGRGRARGDPPGRRRRARRRRRAVRDAGARHAPHGGARRPRPARHRLAHERAARRRSPRRPLRDRVVRPARRARRHAHGAVVRAGSHPALRGGDGPLPRAPRRRRAARDPARDRAEGIAARHPRRR